MGRLSGLVLGTKSLETLRESINSTARQYSFPRVPWMSGIAEYEPPTASNAMGVAAFFQGVRALSGDIASLPWIVYRYLPGGGKERAKDHPLYRPLHRSPNPQVTSFRWREIGIRDLILWGNWYSEIVMDRAGRPQFYRLAPHRVIPYWDTNGERAYDLIQPDGTRKTMRKGSVFHVPGVLGTDELKGLSIIQQARLSLGISIAADKHAAVFWSNGGAPRMFLTLPKGMPDPVKANFRTAWNEAAANSWTDQHGTAMLEDGIVPTVLTMPMDDAQFLETRLFQVTQTASWLDLPPDRVGDYTHANNSTLEAGQIKYVTHSLGPWLSRIDQEVSLQLMGEDEEHFSEFNVDGFLKGDTAARVAYYNAGRSGGWLNVDGIRDKENLNPLPDGLGQTYLQPLNMQPLGGAEGDPSKNPSPTNSDPQPPELVPLPLTVPSSNGTGGSR